MSIKQQTPKIRFTGFSEGWVERELGEIAQFSKGSGYSKADLRVEGSPIILYGRLYTKYQTVIDKVDTFVDEKINSIKSQGNEIIVPASGETAEDIARASAVTQKDIILGGDLNIVRLNDSYSPTFIALKISYGNSKLELAKKAQGKSVVHVRNSDLQSLLLNLPSLQEQTAIGNLFQNIDQTIALQRRKHEQTQTLKKSLLSKMFPKKGQKQPEIRLKGFSGNWVESKFFDNIESIIDFRGRTPKKIGLEWSEKGYLALSALNVKNGYIDFNLDKHFGNEELYQKWMGGKELVAGQVLFTTEAPMGNVAQVPDNKGYILSQRTIAFNIRKDLLTDDFLAILLKSPVTFSMLESMSSGGTAKGVSQKSLANLQVVTPQQLEEQTAIGQFFKQLDDTLSLQAKQLKTLENLKQALLAKMFV